MPTQADAICDRGFVFVEVKRLCSRANKAERQFGPQALIDKLSDKSSRSTKF